MLLIYLILLFFVLLNMAKIAVIKTGGKQYKVSENKIIKIEKLKSEKGKKVEFETLLIADADGKNLALGQPSLKEKVKGEVVEHGQGKKISVVKYKNKTRYLRNKGHRQLYTKVKITSIA